MPKIKKSLNLILLILSLGALVFVSAQLYHTSQQKLSVKDLGILTVKGARYGKNPVLRRGTVGEWDEKGAIDPRVIYDRKDMMWKMWYAGEDSNYIQRIGYAESIDGISWTKSVSNPVLVPGPPGSWDDTSVEQPIVIKQEGKAPLYRIWYGGYSEALNRRAIGYAESDDGVSWVKYSGNPIITEVDGERWDLSGLLIGQDGKYHLWAGFRLSSETGSEARHRHATSDNGITWTLEEDINLTFGPRGSSVLRVDDFAPFPFGDVFIAFASAFVYGPDAQAIDVYISDDGYNWRLVGNSLYPYENVFNKTHKYGYDEAWLVAGPQDDYRLYYRETEGQYLGNISFAYLMFHDKRSYPIIDETSIAKSASTALVDCTEIPTEGVKSLALTVEATFNASATSGIKIHIYTSYDAVNWDTEEQKDAEGNPVFGAMPFIAGSTQRITKYIPSDARFIKVTVENLDTTYLVTSVKVVATLGASR